MYQWKFDENGKPIAGVSFSISFGPSIYDVHAEEYALIKKVAKVVSEELNVPVPEIILVRQNDATLGQYDNGRIFISVGGDISTENIVESVAHEVRHHWQHLNGWEFEFRLPYLERPHEIDAHKYGADFKDKWLSQNPSL